MTGAVSGATEADQETEKTPEEREADTLVGGCGVVSAVVVVAIVVVVVVVS